MRTRGCAHPLTGSRSLRAHKFTSNSDACLLVRSHRDTVRALDRVEVAVENLLSDATTSDQLRSRPLYLSPLAHLGFENPFEESYITHPDLLYRLVRRDTMPIARVSLPSPHSPRFRFRSGSTFSGYPATPSRKIAADQSKAHATFSIPNTPVASITCWAATISVKYVPSSLSLTRPTRCPLTSQTIHFLLPTMRCSA